MKNNPAGTKDDFRSHCSFKDTINGQYLEFCTELICPWRKLWPGDMSAEQSNENHFLNCIMQWNKICPPKTAEILEIYTPHKQIL